MMNEIERAIPTPQVEIIVQRRARRQVFRDSPPLTTGGENVHQAIHNLAQDHRAFVAEQPCVVCAKQPCDAHHVRFAQGRGLGLKVSDEFTVPLCRAHHRQLHRRGREETFWADLKIEPLAIAERLWRQTAGLTAKALEEARP